MICPAADCVCVRARKDNLTSSQTEETDTHLAFSHLPGTDRPSFFSLSFDPPSFIATARAGLLCYSAGAAGAFYIHLYSIL